jgi:fucose 4-O-acetylase-like acetyltransferase
MPMFFFCSGFFYQKNNVSAITYIMKKAKSLLIPYVFFGIFHYLISFFKSGISIKTLIHIFVINTNGLPIAGALWFLTALFFTDVIYYFFDKWNTKWIIILLVLVGSFADQVLPYPLPWALSPSFVGLGLYWIGNFVKINEYKFYGILNMKWWAVLLVGVLTTILIFINGYVNMRTGTYAIIPLFWINALLSVFIIISVSKIIENIFKNTLLEKWLVSIGRNSIIYVCLNQLVIVVITKVVDVFTIPIYASKILIFILSMACLFVLSCFFIRTKLRIFIGK